MNSNNVVEFEELLKLEFLHHANIAAVSTSVYFQCFFSFPVHSDRF